jgi:two-component system C4-dicarboxylate transport sensor histidine kinase DctB
MLDAWSRRPSELRLAAYVSLGAVAGLTYVVFDVLSEAKIRSGTLSGPLAHAHDVVDHVLPILVGVLLGVCAHYLRLRAQLSAAEEAAGRAEALRVRLQKVERDQAVWVLAAAILHEVNNPLHALGLLLDELPACAGRDETRRDDLIARARAQADRALSQLRLLRSVGGGGEPELQRIALDRVVGSLADDIGSLAREDGLSVTLECERPVRASADPVYVRTILENLLDNSLHSLRGRGGRITIRLGVEDGRAVVRVRDDGPPLDPGVRATLFEPLRTTKAHGLGLGLPIARALARAMRGDLALDDGDAGAKSFRLELPLGEGP